MRRIGAIGLSFATKGPRGPFCAKLRPIARVAIPLPVEHRRARCGGDDSRFRGGAGQITGSAQDALPRTRVPVQPAPHARLSREPGGRDQRRRRAEGSRSLRARVVRCPSTISASFFSRENWLVLTLTTRCRPRPLIAATGALEAPGDLENWQQAAPRASLCQAAHSLNFPGPRYATDRRNRSQFCNKGATWPLLRKTEIYCSRRDTAPGPAQESSTWW